MKINNPMKYFPELNKVDAVLYNDLMFKSTLMTRGDIIRKYAPFDSSVETDWHTGEIDEVNDKWVKFSFNGGLTYPLKFSFKNEFIIKLTKDGVFGINDNLDFDLSSYSTAVYEAASNGVISLNSVDEKGWRTNIIAFKYQYNDETKHLVINLLADLPADSKGVVLTIGVDGSNSNALAVSSPVYSTLINAIPTVYDETYGICNLLDENIPSVTCLTKLEDINVLSLKVVTSDLSVTNKTVDLRFNCGNTEFTQTIPVKNTEEWVSINLPNQLSGTLIITRQYNSTNDTLNETMDGVKSILSVCITNIKVERV